MEDYTAIAAKDGAMEEVAQGRQIDEAQVPQGTASVSVHGSAGTSVSLAAPSLGSATLNGGIIYNPPKCTNHSLDSYYATDHLGTVRFVKTVDETGTEVATTTHDYEPFGVEITPTDACDNTHKFTGHERDIETGNDYMHFRFFSASMGRFQKPDSNFDNPGANPQGWNLYSYVKGNPVNFNDPTGHEPKGRRKPAQVLMGGSVWGEAYSGCTIWGVEFGSINDTITYWTTYSTTVYYFGQNGVLSTAINVTWTETFSVSPFTGDPMEGSRMVSDVSASVASTNTDPRAVKAGDAVFTNIAKAILEESPNFGSALQMLAIAMQETHFGLDPGGATNPTQLKGTSNVAGGDLRANIQGSYNVLDYAQRGADSLTDVFGRYTGGGRWNDEDNPDKGKNEYYAYHALLTLLDLSSNMLGSP